jgi:hypothetical protein
MSVIKTIDSGFLPTKTMGESIRMKQEPRGEYQ